jgi:hypothetical protein
MRLKEKFPADRLDYSFASRKHRRDFDGQSFLNKSMSRLQKLLCSQERPKRHIEPDDLNSHSNGAIALAPIRGMRDALVGLCLFSLEGTS